VLVLVRLVAVLFSLSVVVRLLLSLWHALVPVRERREAPPAGVAMVRDRVCNTFLPRERALTATINGREECFCSADCRAKALHLPRSGFPPVTP
jgi:hypothetical protein